MKHIPIVDASEDQLRKFATDVLGLEVHHAQKTSSIIAMIKQVSQKDTIAVDDEPTSTGQVGTPPPNPNPEISSAQQPKTNKVSTLNSSKGDPVVCMYLERSEGKDGARPVPVSVNGVAMLIPRGEECKVPYRYYLNLMNAVRTVFDQDKDGELQPREVLAYPFRVIQMPPQDEIDAWNKAQAETSVPQENPSEEAA